MHVEVLNNGILSIVEKLSSLQRYYDYRIGIYIVKNVLYVEAIKFCIVAFIQSIHCWRFPCLDNQ